MNRAEMIAKLAEMELQYQTIDPFYITEQEARFLCTHFFNLVAAFFAGEVGRSELITTVASARELRGPFISYSDRNYPGYE